MKNARDTLIDFDPIFPDQEWFEATLPEIMVETILDLPPKTGYGNALEGANDGF